MAEPDMDARKRAEAAIADCRKADSTAGIGHYPYEGVMACIPCITSAIEAAVAQEREAIRDYVDTLGSESGYTHVGDLVAWLRARGVGGKTEEKRELVRDTGLVPERPANSSAPSTNSTTSTDRG